MHPYLLHNGSIHKTDEALVSPGQVGFMNGWGIFSTLRVTSGVLFAFERHYARMKRDAERMRVPFEIAPAELKRLLLQLVEANKAAEATLRVAVIRNRGGLFEGPGIVRGSDLVAFTADLNHWGHGVKLGYMPNARYAASPFAGTKYTSWAQNLTWYEMAHERGLDEFILLNEHGQDQRVHVRQRVLLSRRDSTDPAARNLRLPCRHHPGRPDGGGASAGLPDT